MWSAQSLSIPSLQRPASPTAISLIDGSTARIASANWLCFSTYFSSGMWPSCQLPYISLPMLQNFTP